MDKDNVYLNNISDVIITDSDTEPIIEQIYNQINEVLGGDNSQQYFCLTLPGTVLAPEDYTYDITDTKPLKVAANESKLLNKVFDPCHITGSDNGRMLATQYLTALNALTPKLNPNILKAKNLLRDMLNTPYEYHTDDGLLINGTLQQIFYKVYSEYVLEKQKWSELQNKKYEELEAKYPDKTDESKQKKQNEYLEWYETVAESNLAMVESKLGKVLCVFSVNDMKLIESILDSSVGGEIEEAREMVENTRKPHPDGGYVYPVTLQPSDWFKSLSSNFAYMDLLESPDAYSQKYETLIYKRNGLLKKIADFELKDKSTQIGAAVDAFNKSKSDFDASLADLTKDYKAATAELIKTFSAFIPSPDINDEKEKQALEPIVKKINAKESEGGGTKTIDVDTLLDIFSKITTSQLAYTEASQKISDTALKLIDANNNDFTEFLKSSYLDLDNINSDIQALQDKIKVSVVVSSTDNDYMSKLFPDADSKRFMQVLIQTDASKMSSQTDKKSTSSADTYGVNFLFGGYCQEDLSGSSDFKSFTESADTKIEIGFLVTKVSCVRNWFNPGVFLLTRDMYNTSGVKISKKVTDCSKITSKDFDDLNECIFPCFPTAFIIAKDITIKFSSENEFSSEDKNTMEKHASKGGGFLCFHGTSSSASASSNESTCVNSSSKSVTIRIPGAQVIGHYMEMTPEDRSIDIDNISNTATSITEFVSQCKKMLEDMNKSKGGNSNE